MNSIILLLLLNLAALCLSATSHNSVEDSTNLTQSRNETSSNETHHGEHAEGVVLVEIVFKKIKEPIVFTIVVLIAGLSKIGFHYADKVSSLVPESCLLIVIGVIFGGLIKLTQIDESLPEFFTPETFFHYLLPPIILEASFSLYDRTFADNIGSILIYAVIGTTLSCFMIGLSLYGLFLVGAMGVIPEIPLIQMLVFSALIVAVDPVAVLAVFTEVGINPTLYFLVFGESLLNDGVTVVLYNVLQTYNKLQIAGGTIDAVQVVLGVLKFFIVCFGGLFIGVLMGCLSSVLTKFTNTVKVVEPIAIFGMAYLGFLLAELFEFSGIISIIGCGMVQVAYAFHNITSKSKTAIKYFTKVLSTTSEIIIFLFLGLILVREHDWQTGFVVWTTVLCIIFRFIITYGISLLINKFDAYRVRRIGLDEMFIMSYGGLRGAVCFSLVALLKKEEFPEKDMMVTTTIFVILFTVFVQGLVKQRGFSSALLYIDEPHCSSRSKGGTIKPLVNVLRVRLAPADTNPSMYHSLNEKINDHVMAGIEEIVGYTGKFQIREKYHHIDDKYIRKVLLRTPNKEDEGELMDYYQKLVMKEHYKNLHLCGASKLPNVPSGICNVNSSAMLFKLNKGEEDECQDSDEEVAERPKVLFSVDEPTPRDFRNMMDRHASMAHRVVPRKRFDRQLSNMPRFGAMEQLRHKRQSNMRLQRMQSIRKMPERALSWSDNNSDLCKKRGTSQGRSNPDMKNRAVTVDYSPLEADKTLSMSLVGQTILEDTVFEEDENQGGDSNPLLSDDIHDASTHRTTHDVLHRQDAVETVPLDNLTRSKSVD